MSTPIIVSRVDIHKSCKTVEAVVNLLNDYSEAVTAIIGIQKKLAKALREAASTKITSEVAANALNASATVFDTLGDVDTKFAKLVDGECEGISSEVKKWFKMLAKEERQHDQKLASANEKIKRAGGNYERKVKKNPADAVEEHSRYINLLTIVGQETNQEKYNHSLLVNQRQEFTLFSLASSLSRVADGEWLRVCEELRRVSPNIGQVGEWRAFCEANWSGPIPQSLPEFEDVAGPQAMHDSLAKKVSMQGLAPSETAGTPAPEYASRAVTPTEASPQPPTYFSPAKQTKPDMPVLLESEEQRDRSLSVNSIASLGSFPSPPTHFPLPPVPGNLTGNTRQPSSQSSQSSSSAIQQEPIEAASAPEAPSTPIAAPSAKSRKDSATFFDFSSPPVSPTAPTQEPSRDATSKEGVSGELNTPTFEDKGKGSVTKPERSQRVDGTSPGPDSSLAQSYPVGDYAGDVEFGARSLGSKPGPSANPSLSKAIERSDTNRSSGSVVSAIRDKYSRSTGPASPPPRDIPRLPLSVSNLATRYDPLLQGEQTAPRSPGSESPRPSSETRSPALPSSASNQSYSSEDPAPGDIVKRRQRIQELEELELREREYAFRMKEREIREQSRELEREQFELMQARQTRLRADSAAGRNLQHAVAPRPDSYVAPSPQQHPYASLGTGPMSSPSPRYLSQPSSSQPSSPMSSQPLRHVGSRDPLPSPRTVRPPAEPVPTPRSEKPKGNWIRRLSMPVMSNAFSDNSKKGISSADVGSQVYYRNSLALPEEDGRLRTDVINASKNRSVTSLVRR